jgi:hypothetical protein
MKPEKPKKAKAPAKRTRPIAKAEPSSAEEKSARAPAPAKSAGRRKTSESATRPASVPAKTSVLPKANAIKRVSAIRRKVTVPPILLEGDAPAAPRHSGPGERYAFGGTGIAGDESEAELPEAYGTQRMLLVARDPHWLYAHWDLTADQLRQHNAASRDGHLIVRVFRDQPAGKPVVEQHVHPESRNWFLHVGRGGTKYIAQLGYFDRNGTWNTVVTSAATFTPPDMLSDDTSVRFETIPIEVPFAKLLEVVQEAVAEHMPLVEAIQELRERGHTALPELAGISSEPVSWTPAQEKALAEVVNVDEVRRVWMGSLEITELIRRSLEKEISSQAAAALARGERPAAEISGVFSVSSPFGGAAKRKGFWFNVNAELIIYGATEPDASVTIGGRPIQLRRDGSFSFRFALPDGNYDLPVQATSSDGGDSRQAKLHFRRATEYRGDVTAHPQDSKLKTPRVENVS